MEIASATFSLPFLGFFVRASRTEIAVGRGGEQLWRERKTKNEEGIFQRRTTAKADARKSPLRENSIWKLNTRKSEDIPFLPLINRKCGLQKKNMRLKTTISIFEPPLQNRLKFFPRGILLRKSTFHCNNFAFAFLDLSRKHFSESPLATLAINR